MRNNMTTAEIGHATSSVLEALRIVKGNKSQENDSSGMRKDITAAELKDATLAIQQALDIIQADGEEESEQEKNERREARKRSRLEGVWKHNALNERRITAKSYSEKTLNDIAQNFTNYLKGKEIDLEDPVVVVDARKAGIPDDHFSDEVHEIFLAISLKDKSQSDLIPDFFSNIQVRQG